MALDMLENMLGTLVKASRILVYDWPLPYEECLSWIYCPEITPAAAARSFLRNGCNKAKMHAMSSHKNCIWNVPLLLFSVICRIYSSDTHFMKSSFTTSFSGCLPQQESFSWRTSIAHFFFAASQWLWTNWISLLPSPMPTLKCLISLPPKLFTSNLLMR